jgi:hypothetical protein
VLATSIYMVVFRVLHVLLAIVWAGTVFLLVLIPPTDRQGDQSGGGPVHAGAARHATPRRLDPPDRRYAETSGDDLLIRLEPGELRAWDFADYFA